MPTEIPWVNNRDFLTCCDVALGDKVKRLLLLGLYFTLSEKVAGKC